MISRWKFGIRSIELALLVFFTSVGVQWFVYAELLREPGSFRLIGPATAGVITGILTYRLQRTEAQHRKSAEACLDIILDVNHHIRNALQVISYKSFIDGQQTAAVSDAINRIDWVLRDILPRMSFESTTKTNRKPL